MARKKKNKETKIVREFVETRFKEVKSESKPNQESELEQDVGKGKVDESDSFVDLSSDERTSSLLRPSQTSATQELETNLGDAPKPSPNENFENASKYVQVYSKPSYNPGGGEERTSPIIRDMRESGVIVRQDNIAKNMLQRTERIRDWHEIQPSRSWEETVVHSERLEEERGLPFEKKKYKPRNL